MNYAYQPNSNVLTAIDAQAVTHDAAGNRTSDSLGLNNSNRTFEYNAAGRLFKVYEGGALKATYTYNHLGQRTHKVTASGTTLYHYDQHGNLISETTAEGAPLRDLVYRDAVPVAQIDVGQTTESITWLHTDHLGTPRRGTDDNGVVVWTWQSDAFGSTAANQDPDQDGIATVVNLRFPGQYYDTETGLHYNWHRYYDPATGRYIESDPIGLRGGINTFAYVEGNPLSLVDPDGLLACTYDIPSHTLSCSNNAGQSFSTNVTASGLGQCRDNPQCVDKPFKGPLPPGAYTIRPPGWSQRRPRWLYLDPDAGNQMHKRGGFFIHPWGISNGCIILHIPDFNTISGWAKQDGGGTLNVRD